MSARHRSRLPWRETVLTAGALFGAACLVLAAVALVLDVRPLVVRSGSMSPAIGTGALAVVRTVDAADLDVGDVVSVRTAAGPRVMHRVLALDRRGETARLTLQGDANAGPDPVPYEVESADRVLLDVPGLGYVAAWLAGPVGLVVLGGYAAFLVSVIARRPAARRAAVGLSVVGLVGAGLGGLGPARTWAAWTDVAAAGSGSLAATTVLPPTHMTCTNNGALLGALLGYYGSVTFSFPHRDAAYDYVVRVYRSDHVQAGGDVTVSGVQDPVGADLTYRLTASRLQELLSLGGDSYVRVYAVLRSSPSWASATYREWRIRSLAVLLSIGVRCDAATV